MPPRDPNKASRTLVQTMVAMVICFALGIGLLLAADANRDLLNDTWEQSYGLPTPGPYSSTNLIGWWQLDDTNITTVNDNSTNGWNGSMANFATNAYQPGYIYNGLQFTTNSVATFTAPTNAVVPSAFTFSAWYNSTDSSTNQIIATQTTTNGYNWQLAVDGGYPTFIVEGPTNSVTVTHTTAIGDGAWHLVSAGMTATAVPEVGVGTNLITSAAVPDWNPQGTPTMAWGDPSNNSTFMLDEVYYYNRALSTNNGGVDEYLMIPPTYSDIIGKGWSVYQDYTHGTDPLKIDTDGDGIPDVSDPYPLDYYNNVAPTLSVVSGNNQWCWQNYSTPAPLVLTVSSGSGPLTNAPVTFSSSTGLISTSAMGPAYASQALVTDGSGHAQVWYWQGSGFGTGTVTATASYTSGTVTASYTVNVDDPNVSSTNLNFRVDCLHGVTTNSSGYVSSWASEYNSHVAAQTNSALMPRVPTTNNVAGFQGVTFSGSSLLTVPSSTDLDDPGDFTLVAIMGPTPSGPTGALYGKTGVTGGYLYGWSTYCNWTSSINTNGSIDPGSSWGGNYNTTTSGYYTGPGYTPANPIVLVYNHHNGNTIDYYLNDYKVLTLSQSNETSTFPVSIGEFTTATGLKGTIADLFYYQRSLSAAEVQTVSKFAGNKYGFNLFLQPLVISPLGGTYTGSKTVTASCATPNSVIYYTTDGTTPTTASPVWSGSTTLTTTTTLSFLAAEPGYNSSAVQTYTYTITPNYAPTQLTGLIGWWTADTGYTSLSGAWADQSGNGVVLTPGTNSPPTYVASATYSKPALRFNGTNQGLSSLIPGLTTSVVPAVMAVVRPSLSNTANSFLNVGFCSYGVDSSFSSALSLTYQGVKTLLPYYPQSDLFLAEFPLNTGSSCPLYVNGQLLCNLNTSINSGGSTTNAISIPVWQGDIEEILVFNHVPTTTDRQAAEAYLMAKYGLNDSDGSGVPDWKKVELGLSTTNPDSNGDGINDGESLLLGINPLTTTTSGQNATSNANSLASGSNPFVGTTYDYIDVLAAFSQQGYAWSPPAPNPEDHTPPVITLQTPSGATPE